MSGHDQIRPLFNENSHNKTVEPLVVHKPTITITLTYHKPFNYILTYGFGTPESGYATLSKFWESLT